MTFKSEPAETQAASSPIRDRRPAPRAALRRPVRLHFASFRDFIEAATRNISETGMLLHTGVTRPVGTQFEFSIALGDGLRLVEGTAEVVWVNHEDDGTPCGMGVKFLELTGDSLELVQKIVEADQGADSEPP